MGVVAVWFSFPLVFVMAGVGGTVLLACWREQTRPALPGFAAVVGAWLLAFGCQYVLFARPLAAFLQRKAGGQDVVLVFNDNSSFAVYGRLLAPRRRFFNRRFCAKKCAVKSVKSVAGSRPREIPLGGKSYARV